MAEAAQVLKELVQAWNVQIDSTGALAGAVADAAAKDDKERREDGRRPPSPPRSSKPCVPAR
ncbi:hypothetical protein ACIQW4_25285 [Streptomyces albogriseolus]|uniref:hypothetical protein n=1 Tax=Streptomyces albogriseolus TaxID=1887 RepID=UPI00382C6BBC